MSIFAAHMLPVLANGIVEDLFDRLSGAEQIQSPWHRFQVPVFFVRLGPMDPMVPAATMAANIPLRHVAGADVVTKWHPLKATDWVPSGKLT